MPTMLDLFCGRGGWSNAFLERGWRVVGIDVVWHPTYRGEFVQRDVLTLTTQDVSGFDFVCASSPCEEFSVHNLKHFYPNPRFPDMGLVLFCWTRRLLDRAKVPYVMENVRAAEQFVGRASHRCGSFYLWGNSVPPLVHKGITKGYRMDRATTLKRSRRKDCPDNPHAVAARMATIPPELANCVADYAERLLEQRESVKT